MAATVTRPVLTHSTVDKRIPVINNVFTDKDIEEDVKQLPKLPVPNIEKVVKLLTDKHSKNLISRHRNAVKRLTKYFSNGFLLKDIKNVSNIVAACTEKINIDSIYESCIIDVLKCLRCPFLKENMSDEEKYLEDAILCASEIGQKIEESTENVILQFANSIGLLYTYSSDLANISALGARPVTTSFLKAVVERSRVCYSLTVSLTNITLLDTRLEIMQTLQQLSDSRLNCDDMLAADAAGMICATINSVDPSRRLLYLTVDVLWNLIENGSKEEVVKQLDCKKCVSALKEAFLAQSQAGNSLADCQIRNDLLVFASMVVAWCPDAPFVVTGFTQVLSLMASYPEVASKSELVRKLKLQEKHEDFELKKMLFTMLVPLSKEIGAVKVMVQQKILLALFHYIRPINSALQTHWSPSQFEELQLLALSVLCAISPLCVDEYISCQGNTRLLLLLEWCLDLDGFGGHGNSYFGTGGRGSKRAQMRYTLRLLRSVSATQDDQILQDLVDQGAINQFVNILHNATTSTDENDSIDIEMQCDMLFILATLCEGDSHRKELFGEQGVVVLINFLKTSPEKVLSVHGHRRLVLASMDCLWSAVLNCYLNEALFLEREGVFLLLDVLETCPVNMQGMVLGAILDFSENPKTLPHIKLWRGKNELTAGKLMVDLWKDEEERLMVAKSDSGIIKDISNPILSKVQEMQGIFPLPSTSPSPAIVDVSENIRAKIYSIFCKIGFNNVAGLKTGDYVTLAVIEQYLEFKTLEVWREIKTELFQETVRPISPDLECMDSVIRVLEDRAESVASVQAMLIDAEAKQEVLDEEGWYQKIRESHRQEEKAYQDFVDYVKRTSDFTALRTARQNQLNAVEHSRLQSRGLEQNQGQFHEILPTRLQTTTFCNRQVTVQSTPVDIVRATDGT